jgi:hypothetical protein
VRHAVADHAGPTGRRPQGWAAGRERLDGPRTGPVAGIPFFFYSFYVCFPFSSFPNSNSNSNLIQIFMAVLPSHLNVYFEHGMG